MTDSESDADAEVQFRCADCGDWYPMSDAAEKAGRKIYCNDCRGD